MNKHIPWPDIDNMHTLRRTLAKHPELLGGRTTVSYNAKVKLHGTNAGVRVDVDTEEVTALSRTAVITPNNDNAGFARWVESQKDAWLNRAAQFLEREPDDPSHAIIFYGEWCGPGVQKGVAVTQIPNKVFAVFAVRNMCGIIDDLYVDPFLIDRYFVPKELKDVYVIPWFNEAETFVVDWTAPVETLKSVTDRINDHVMAIEACDPWVKETFGIEGVGEGLVMYPCVDLSHPYVDDFKNLSFKCKGEKHQVVAHTKPAQVDATVATNVNAFVDLVLPETRLEQGARAVSATGDLDFDVKSMGAFLSWIAKDVDKETQAELEASGLDKKVAMKAVSARARAWFLDRIKG